MERTIAVVSVVTIIVIVSIYHFIFLQILDLPVGHLFRF